MKRFRRTPQKMLTYLTPQHKQLVQRHIPVEYKWTWEFDQTQTQIDIWYNREPRGSVKDYYTKMSSHGGQIGIHYMRQRGRTIKSIDDYKLFVSERPGRQNLGSYIFNRASKIMCTLCLGHKPVKDGPSLVRGQSHHRHR